jgi:spermidine synthase
MVTNIIEFTHGKHSAHMFQVKKRLAHEKTKYQTVDIVELYHYGKTLFLDKKLQCSEMDEFIYHESIVHPAMVTHPNPKNVLVIGGGDGGSVREVLKHNCVERVLMLEIDEKSTNLCKKFLPEIHQNCFANPKLTLIHQDARTFLEKNKEKFDVIISDLTAPVVNPPSYLLFTKQFFKIIYNSLNDDGVFSLQADSTSCIDTNIFTTILRTLSEVFPIVKGFQSFIPSYDITWGFIIASKKFCPETIKEKTVEGILKKRNVKNLRYYDGKMHSSLFILPRYLRDAIKNQKNIIEDNKPIISYI